MRKPFQPKTKNRATINRGTKPLPDIQFGPAVLQDAESLLLKAFGRQSESHLPSREWIGLLRTRQQDVRKISRRQHYEALALAYATYVRFEADPEALETLVTDAASRKRSVSRKVSMLRLIIEQHITYGDATDPKQVRAAQNMYSRDEQALLSLMRRNVPASEIVALAEKPGEGMVNWSRDTANSNKRVPKKKPVRLSLAAPTTLIWRGTDGEQIITSKGTAAYDLIRMAIERLKEIPGTAVAHVPPSG